MRLAILGKRGMDLGDTGCDYQVSGVIDPGFGRFCCRSDLLPGFFLVKRYNAEEHE
jgi:hypothetical protein